MGMQRNTFIICGTRGLSWGLCSMLESGSEPVYWAASGAKCDAKKKGNMESK